MKMTALDHVRRATVPWRSEDQQTECGRPLTDVAAWIDRDEVLRRVAEWGKRRTAMSVCITCWDTMGRWPTWETSPVEVLTRYLSGASWYRGESTEGKRVEREVRALAALVAAHRGEFDGYVTGLAETGDLSAARTARRGRGTR